METTLTPPPNEAERKMIVEIAFEHMRQFPIAVNAFVKAESFISECRSRYGANAIPATPKTADIEALKAENERLREALEAIANSPTPYNETERSMWMTTTRRIALEALKGGDNGKTV